MFHYLVLCRVHPKSGFDLALHNKALNALVGAVKGMAEEDEETGGQLMSSLMKYKEENKGYVLEIIPIVSDNEITDPENEVMPEIRKTYEGAKFLRFVQVPEESVESSDGIFIRPSY